MANCFYVIAGMRVCTSLLGKRHALRAHIPEAATDWLNPLSLGTMSASGYIGNLA